MKIKIKKLIYLSIITFLLVMVKCITVQAASAEITPSALEPYEGDSVTVKADVTAGAWDLQFEGAGKSETLFGYTQANANASDSKTITFTAGAVGTTYKFTLTGNMTDITASDSESVNKSITITVKAKETPEVKPPVEITTQKSNDATLSNLGIRPNDFKGFKKETYSYTHEVPNDVSKVYVYAYASSDKATLSGDANKYVTLKEGLNEIQVIVTAEAGNKKTYTLNLTRAVASDEGEKEESEARLKNLGIKPNDFSGFKKDTMSYSHEVPNEVEEIEIYAEAVDPKATITGTGKVTLKEGLNKIAVQVTSADGKFTETYTLEIMRASVTEVTDEPDEDMSADILGLAKLQITGITINPKFDVETYEYKADLKEDLSKLEIIAKANNENATVEIIGNENLKQGENIITILVANTETEEIATYQIVVDKNVVVVDVVGKVDWLKPSTWGTREIVLIASVVVLLIIIIVAIILKVRLSKSEIKDMEFPGAEELDRALAEHQELSDEEILNQTQEATVELKQEENNYYEETIQYDRPKRKGKHF